MARIWVTDRLKLSEMDRRCFAFQRLDRDGFAFEPLAVAGDRVAQLIKALARLTPDAAVRKRDGRTYAVRNLLRLSPEVRELSGGEAVRKVVEPVLGPEAKVVRAILFDKAPGANWKVAWHQDLSIAVRSRLEVPGFGPWSVKAGVPHVQPPRELLEQMLTVRLHLDDCGPDNGPLNVIPGSHALGILSPDEVARFSRDSDSVACHIPRGGALLMRPLLLHSSGSARASAHRRVVHLEFASATLPPGLEWAEGI